MSNTPKIFYSYSNKDGLRPSITMLKTYQGLIFDERNRVIYANGKDYINRGDSDDNEWYNIHLTLNISKDYQEKIANDKNIQDAIMQKFLNILDQLLYLNQFLL